MKIQTTEFNSEHYGSKIIDSSNYGDYMLHCVDICNEITVDNKTFSAIYQTACGFTGNDYNAPTEKLELSEEADTCRFLTLIDETDVNDEDDFDGEILEYLRDLSGINQLSKDDVRAVKAALSDNLAAAKSEFVELELSDDANDWHYDYDEDFEQLGYATVK